MKWRRFDVSYVGTIVVPRSGMAMATGELGSVTVRRAQYSGAFALLFRLVFQFVNANVWCCHINNVNQGERMSCGRIASMLLKLRWSIKTLSFRSLQNRKTYEKVSVLDTQLAPSFLAATFVQKMFRLDKCFAIYAKYERIRDWVRYFLSDCN